MRWSSGAAHFCSSEEDMQQIAHTLKSWAGDGHQEQLIVPPLLFSGTLSQTGQYSGGILDVGVFLFGPLHPEFGCKCNSWGQWLCKVSRGSIIQSSYQFLLKLIIKQLEFLR